MNQKQVYRQLAHFLRPVRGRFAISLMLLIVTAVLAASKAFIIRPVVDGFLGGTPSSSDLMVLCIIVGGVFVVQALAGFAYEVVARMASARMINTMRRELFARLTKQSLAYFSARPSSDLLSRVVYDVAAFESAAVGAIQALVRDVLVVSLLLVVMVMMNAKIALFCIGVVVVTAIILRKMSGKVKTIGRKVQEAASGLNRELAEMIGGMDVVLGFGLADPWQKSFAEKNEDLYRAQVRKTRVSESAVLLVTTIVGLAITGLLAMMGYAVLNGSLTPGEFAAMLASLYLMQQPAVQIGRSVANIANGIGAVGRALELLAHEPTVVEPTEPRSMREDTTIEFDHVGFHYKDNAPILRDVSFKVEPGELIAIIGDSGAGKSTAAKLLMRFYDPHAGEVRIGGLSLRDVARHELYERVSHVAQDIYLFDGTIEFNLRVGNPDATKEELQQAVRIACVDDFLAEMPDGLATRVGERGASISGGQRQRIAIARAILAKAPILVLDEATSALDMELEQRILQNLVDASRGRTIIAVTHRLSLATIADRIIVLKDGILAEEGQAEVLAMKGGEFARLKAAAARKLQRSPVRSS